MSNDADGLGLESQIGDKNLEYEEGTEDGHTRHGADSEPQRGTGFNQSALTEMAQSIQTLTQVVTSLSKKSTPETATAGPSRPRLKRHFLQYQYELNTEWADALRRALDHVATLDLEAAKSTIQETVDKITKRNDLLEAGDEHPEIFTEMSKLQQAEKLASVTGLPKGDLMKILKQPQKAEPEVQAKRARYEPYPRQPFPSTGPGRWPAAGSGNGYYDRSSFE